jgi:hypothetical protein
MKAAVLILLLMLTVAAVALTWGQAAWYLPLRHSVAVHDWQILGFVAALDVLILSCLGTSDEMAE